MIKYHIIFQNAKKKSQRQIWEVSNKINGQPA